MKPVRIPTRADEPPHMFLWSADEVLPIVGGLGIGILVDQVFICVLVGGLATNLYRRFRDRHSHGYQLHLPQHDGFGFSRSPTIINPLITRLIP